MDKSDCESSEVMVDLLSSLTISMMKNIKILLAIGLTSILILSGCRVSDGPEQNPEKVVKEGFSNFYDLDAYTYEISFSGNVDADETNVNFELSLEGGQDTLDPKDPRLVMALEGSGSVDDGDEQEVKGELRINSENIFFSLASISDFDGLIPTEMLEPFVGKWWNMPVPPNAFDSLVIASGADEDLPPEMQATKKLLKDTLFFKDLKYLGIDDGSYHYSGVLDEDAVMNFIQEMAKINNDELNESDIEEMEESFEAIELEVEIWVDTEEMILSGLSGDVDYEKDENKVEFNFELFLGGFNESFEVEVPEESEEFNPLMLLGLPADGELPIGDFPIDGDIPVDINL